MQNKNFTIDEFSEHLFWDVDKSKLDLNKNESFFIQRVLEYGLLIDWQLLTDYYGLKKIGELTTKMRDLDSKSLSFISTITQIPIENFLCYTTKQSTPKHWNF